MLFRDDPSPAPWTKEGQQRMKDGGFDEMVKPPGHDEYLRVKALEQEEKLAKKAAEKGEVKAKGKKRKIDDDDQNADETDIKKKAAGDTVPKPKTEVKSKSTLIASYKISIEEKAVLKEDTANKKLWTEVISGKYLNKKELTDKIEEQFCCMICQDLVFKPVSNTFLQSFVITQVLILFNKGDNPLWPQHLPGLPQPQLQGQRIPLPKLQVNYQLISYLTQVAGQ